ncbi:MAG: Uncharacterised protein [Flavobacteriaceae bacterium]|nr:MAG: Uncharacterised protein [Flavobacteriaceae bacterium]
MLDIPHLDFIFVVEISELFKVFNQSFYFPLPKFIYPISLNSNYVSYPYTVLSFTNAISSYINRAFDSVNRVNTSIT